jgi:hypothetical protein
METAQEATIIRLVKKGYWVNATDDDTVFMMKRLKGGTTLYADVEADGTVSGKSLDEFLKSIK